MSLADVRPAVTLRLSIDDADYREKIGDIRCTADCLALQNALRDSLVAITRLLYPFLNWDDPQHATDTILAHLTARPGSLPWLLLILHVRPQDAGMPPDSMMVDFENFSAFRDRDDRNDWSVQALRVQWSKHLREMLPNQAFVSSAFGRVPIRAPASTIPGNRWKVDVARDSIHQVQYENPTFQIRTLYQHPIKGSDSVSVLLADCNSLSDFSAYNCGTVQIRFTSGTVVTGAALDSALSGATLGNASRVRLVTFKADTTRKATGGVIWP